MTEHIRSGDSLAFFKLRNENMALAYKNKAPYLLSYCYEKTGTWYYYQGEYKTTILYFDSAITVCKKNGLQDLTSVFCMNMGSVHYMSRNYTESLNYFKSSQEIMEKIKSDGLPMLYGNMALLYQEIGDLENAKKYLYRNMPFVKLKKEKDSYAKSLNNLALIYKKENNYKAADSIYRIGYELTKANDLKDDYADITYNLVNLLTIQKNFTEAKELNVELLEHVKKYKDASWIKQVKQNMAQICYSLKDISSAKKYLNESESILIKDEDMDEDDINSLLTIAVLYYKLGVYDKSSFAFHKHYELSEKNGKEKKLMDAAQLSYKYEKHKDSITVAKEKEIAELENLRVQEKAEAKLKQQRIIIFVSLFGFILIIGFSISLIRANRNKEKANKEISYQKGLLTEKNKEITDSITYAQRIQQSLLPPLDLLEILLPKHFLVYMPKDIVSGDFFWAKKLNSNEVFVAVADCTGHGVPGAMMSALSIQNLNELSTQTRSASELLSLLNTNLKNTLNQGQEGFSKDGLDICLCKINTKEKKVTYSGANRSLQIFNEKGLKQEIKATKIGIAGHTLDSQIYAEHEVTLEDNDMVVMSTDGFADQFGGTENKKITTKRFKEWMSEIVSINDKKTELEQRFNAWKGSKDQIDDVCVLGFKI
ncbi:MAG: SpoIIE family protein phosphatase [Bacteroidia bacterium]|nr:SpoIIE family protein phosphatase [Bacteroidia bacterium]